MSTGWKESYTRYRGFFLNITALYKKRVGLQAFLEIILSLLTVIMFLVFALKPTALTIIDLLQQIKEKQATLSALTQKVADLQTASNLLQQNQSYIPNINIAVPTVPNPNVLSEQVEGLAAKNSINILGISVDQVSLVGNSTSESSSELKPLPGNAKGMPFSVSLGGKFSDLLSLIKDFENMRISTKVDTLNINSSVTGKGLTIIAIISGRVPFLGK